MALSKFYILVILIFCLNFATTSLAQDNGIVGKVIDSKSNEPVPFASVKIWMNKGLFGVITNMDGGFQIPAENKNSIDSVVISCIGYTNRLISISQLESSADHKVFLTPSAVQLSEVVVKGKRLAPSKIIELAMLNIPKNYPQKSFSYVGYYRDYQLKDNDYCNLNEAIVAVNDKGFNWTDFDFTTLALLQYKENNSFIRNPSTAIPYDQGSNYKSVGNAHLGPYIGGNELSFLRIHDAIRNYNRLTYSFVDTFRSNFVKNHSFKYVKTVTNNNTPLYHITFHTKSDRPQDYFAKGEIYVERGNFAIHKFAYTLYERGKSKPFILYDVVVEYTRRESLMYPNYISVNNFFKVKNTPFKVLSTEYDSINYMMDLTLNTEPEPNSALNKANYDLRLDKKKLTIVGVKNLKTDRKRIQIFLSKAEIATGEKMTSLIPRIKTNFKKIKNGKGAALNVSVEQTMYQFREFFLQKLNQPNDHMQYSVSISKESPLSKSSTNRAPKDVSAYWMNTPLRSK